MTDEQEYRRNRRKVVFKTFIYALLHDPLNAFTAARDAGTAMDMARKIFNFRRQTRGIDEKWTG